MYILSPGFKSRYFLIVFAVASSRPVLTTTHFGSPVVPEVNMRLRRVSMLMLSWRELGIGVELDSEANNSEL